jgi:hypothetical protein
MFVTTGKGYTNVKLYFKMLSELKLVVVVGQECARDR